MATGNQKRIRVNKTVTNKKCNYLKLEMPVIDKALKELQDTAFKLYIYIAKNSPDYTFDLSSKDFTNKTGKSRGAYDRAVSELIRLGYLVEVPGKKNLYNFYDSPQRK